MVYKKKLLNLLAATALTTSSMNNILASTNVLNSLALQKDRYLKIWDKKTSDQAKQNFELCNKKFEQAQKNLADEKKSYEISSILQQVDVQLKVATSQLQPLMSNGLVDSVLVQNLWSDFTLVQQMFNTVEHKQADRDIAQKKMATLQQNLIMYKNDLAEAQEKFNDAREASEALDYFENSFEKLENQRNDTEIKLMTIQDQIKVADSALIIAQEQAKNLAQNQQALVSVENQVKVIESNVQEKMAAIKELNPDTQKAEIQEHNANIIILQSSLDNLKDQLPTIMFDLERSKKASDTKVKLESDLAARRSELKKVKNDLYKCEDATKKAENKLQNAKLVAQNAGDLELLNTKIQQIQAALNVAQQNAAVIVVDKDLEENLMKHQKPSGEVVFGHNKVILEKIIDEMVAIQSQLLMRIGENPNQLLLRSVKGEFEQAESLVKTILSNQFRLDNVHDYEMKAKASLHGASFRYVSVLQQELVIARLNIADDLSIFESCLGGVEKVVAQLLPRKDINLADLELGLIDIRKNIQDFRSNEIVPNLISELNSLQMQLRNLSPEIYAKAGQIVEKGFLPENVKAELQNEFELVKQPEMQDPTQIYEAFGQQIVEKQLPFTTDISSIVSQIKNLAQKLQNEVKKYNKDSASLYSQMKSCHKKLQVNTLELLDEKFKGELEAELVMLNAHITAQLNRLDKYDLTKHSSLVIDSEQKENSAILNELGNRYVVSNIKQMLVNGKMPQEVYDKLLLSEMTPLYLESIKKDPSRTYAGIHVTNDAIGNNVAVVNQKIEADSAAISAGENYKQKGGVWLELTLATNKAKNDSNGINYDSKGGGIVLGADYKINNTTLGLFLGVNAYAINDDNNSGDENDLKQDNLKCTLGGAYFKLQANKNLSFSAIGGMSTTSLSGEKANGNKTKLDRDLKSYFADIRAKYKIQLSDKLALMPNFGFKVYNNDSFSYLSGNDIINKYEASTNKFMVIGTNVAIGPFIRNHYTIAPEFHVFGELALDKNENIVTTSFLGNDITSTPVSKKNYNLLNVGGSVAFQREQTSFSLGLDWNSRKNYNGFAGKLNIRINL